MLLLEKLQDLIEAALKRSDFTKVAPFSRVHLIYKLGLSNEVTPSRMELDNDSDKLLVSLEVDTRELLGCTDEEFLQSLLSGAQRAFDYISDVYGLEKIDVC